MEISKNWKDWAEWVLLGAVAVLLVPWLLPYMDKQLVQNEYAIGVKVGVVSLIIAFASMILRNKIKQKNAAITEENSFAR